jgi:hypothetical protein
LYVHIGYLCVYQYVYYILLCVIQYTVLFSTQNNTLNCLVFVSALATKPTLASSLSLSRTRYIVKCAALTIFLNLVYDLCYWACIKYFILDTYVYICMIHLWINENIFSVKDGGMEQWELSFTSVKNRKETKTKCVSVQDVKAYKQVYIYISSFLSTYWIKIICIL